MGKTILVDMTGAILDGWDNALNVSIERRVRVLA